MPVWWYYSKAIAPGGYVVALYEGTDTLKATIKMNMHWAFKYKEFHRGRKVREIGISPYERCLKLSGSPIDPRMLEMIAEQLRRCFTRRSLNSDAPKHLTAHLEMIQKSNVELA